MNIIELAKEAGLLTEYGFTFAKPELLERFAALVAEAERQRTIEILMDLHRKANGEHNYYHFAANEIRGFSV